MTNAAADPLFAATQRALAGVYSLERELGRGGMGVVYLAREVELDRFIALKVLPLTHAADRHVREQFVREACMAASLSHPHVVPIHRVGESGDIVYFSMAYVDGETLGEPLRARGPLSPSAATRMLREVAQALAYAHGRGIVHRDVKPDNILLERETGRALVSDFGIAGAPQGASAEPVMGTVHFMSPEQAAGTGVDARSDLYSLGVVGYLALSGALPRHGVSLVTASPATPSHLISAIDRAMAIDPEERYVSAEMFADALESRVTVRELPAPLREWLETRDPWRMPYLGWTALTLVGGTIDMLKLGLGDAWPIYALSTLPLFLAALFQSRKARRLFAAGYDVDDIRAALATRSQPDKSVEHRWWHSVARIYSLTSIACVGGFFVNPMLARTLFLSGLMWLMPAIALSALLSLPLLSALGVPMVPTWVGRAERRVVNWFWNSRFGRRVGEWLMRGRQRTVPAHAFRATEHVLATAVEDLYRALPQAYRDQLHELPDVIERLQDHAQRAREELAHFDGVTAVARDNDLATARERARRALTDSVSALETIRLDLLRLVGGDADLRPTTTAIDAAQRVDRDIARLHEAERIVERTIRPLGLDLRPYTPA